MYISPNSTVATLALLSPLSSAANIGHSQLEARDNLAVIKSVLVALKASAFCSSFVPIKDVTSTYTKTGTPGYTQVTVTAPCTNAYKKDKRQISTTPAAPSTTSRVSTTSSKTTTAATTPSKCTIKGVPSPVATYGCSIITEACKAFVKPKTVTVIAQTLDDGDGDLLLLLPNAELAEIVLC